MPSGYTSRITDDMTLRDFVLICAHAFGPFLGRRDQGVSLTWPEAEPSSYRKKWLEQAKAELEEVRAWTSEQAQEAADAHVKYMRESREKSRNESTLLRARYERMLEMVMGWEPPEEWPQIKAYMIEQITDSIKYDCHDEEFLDSCYKIPEGLTGEAWKANRMAIKAKEIEELEEHWEKEVARAKKANELILALRKSLGDLP